MSWTEFITQDVNISISDKNDHYSSKQIIKIFNKTPNEIISDDLYVLKTIFTESHLQAVYNFFKEANIDFNQAKQLYTFLKSRGIENEKFNWFFRV